MATKKKTNKTYKIVRTTITKDGSREQALETNIKSLLMAKVALLGLFNSLYNSRFTNWACVKKYILGAHDDMFISPSGDKVYTIKVE